LATAAQHHLPEPWVGRLEVAPLLFLSSNPSINPDEDFPTSAWPNASISSYFQDRFQSGAVLDGVRFRRQEGSYGPPNAYWTEIKNRATELFGRTVVAGIDYALTEVVHCKSRGNFGVADALKTCAPEHLVRVLERSVAKTVICNGKWARLGLQRVFGIALECPSLVGPILLAGRPRMVLAIAAPGSSGPRKLDKVLTAQQLTTLRRFTLGP
jgi:hypothetical protein